MSILPRGVWSRAFGKAFYNISISLPSNSWVTPADYLPAFASVAQISLLCGGGVGQAVLSASGTGTVAGCYRYSGESQTFVTATVDAGTPVYISTTGTHYGKLSGYM